MSNAANAALRGESRVDKTGRLSARAAIDEKVHAEYEKRFERERERERERYDKKRIIFCFSILDLNKKTHARC